MAVWARALNQTDVQNVLASGIQTPIPQFAPGFSVNPTGATNLIAGDSWNLKAGVYGSRPLTYQWTKNGNPVPDAATPILALTNLTTADSGDYALVVSNAQGHATSQIAKLAIGSFAAPSNLGTPHTGAGGTVDSYIRTDAGAMGDHKYTTATDFDSTWHNVVYVQRQAGGVHLLIDLWGRRARSGRARPARATDPK